jgi:hypothetical protein
MSSKNWIGSASGNWSDGADWSGGAAPANGDTVTIDTAKPLTVTFAEGDDVSLDGLTVDADTLLIIGGALTDTGALSIENLVLTGGQLNVSGGVIDNLDQTGGVIDIAGQTQLELAPTKDATLGGAVTGAGLLVLDAGVTTVAKGATLSTAALALQNAGSQSTTTLALDEAVSYSGAFTLNAGTLVELNGGKFTLQHGATLAGGGISGSYAFITEGATSASTVTIGGAVVWDNAGVVTQSNGNVTIGGANARLPTELDNLKGATWNISDESGFDRGAAAGSFILNAGAFAKTSTSGTSVLSVNFRSTGTVSCAGGDLEFDGAHNSISGTYIGPGMIDYGPDGVTMLHDLAITQSACGTNYGIVDVTGLVTIADGSTIMNDAGAHWNFDGNFGLTLASGSTSPSMTSAGTIAKTAGVGTSVVEIDIDDMGTVSVATGTLDFTGASNSFDGLIKGAGVIEFGGGGSTLGMGASLTVAGLIVSGKATTLTIASDVSYAGHFRLASGATLDENAADLDLTGTGFLGAGILAGSQALQTAGTFTIDGLQIGGGGIVNGGALNQSGVSATLDGSAILVNGAKGIYDILDNTGVQLGQSGLGDISNSGLFEKTGGAGISVIAATIANDKGMVKVASGELDLQGALTGQGTADIGAASILEAGAAVASAETIEFHGVAGELILGDPKDFAADVSGFKTAGDKIKLLGSWTYQSFAETNGEGILTFANASAHETATLALVGSYALHDFTIVGNVVTYK